MKHISTSSGSGGGSGSSAKQVGVLGLTAMVISAIVGAGIFNLPQNMAATASAGGQIIAWIITGVGMWFIANTFRILSDAFPDLKNGLYSYARAGFGKFVGFFVAYGYWISNCFCNIAYGVMVMSTLGFFIPHVFGDGSNLAAIICASVLSWGMVLLALRGVKSGSLINLVGTIGKLLPVLIFIIALITVFQFSTFMDDFWGRAANGTALSFNLENISDQVSSTMLTTLFLFIGIEGAVVMSGSARSQKDVSFATTAGYIIVLICYVLVSLLPLGIDNYTEVAKMSDPSMAAVMQLHFGEWGAVVVNVGVIISILSSWLVWLFMLAQMPLYAAKDGLFPKRFAETDDKGTPKFALIITGFVCQALFILCLFLSKNAWGTLVSITSILALPCYLACCMFLWKSSLHGKWPAKSRYSSKNALFTGVVGTIFSVYLLYASGVNYVMVACLIYVIGVPLYIVGRKEAGVTGGVRSMFGKWELVLLAAVIVAGIAGIIFTVVTS